MNSNELLHFAVTQNQYIEGYDKNNPLECYNKVLNSYRQLYDKVVNYCVLGTLQAPQSLKTSPVDNYEPPKKKTRQNELQIGTFKKDGSARHPKLQNWRNYRDDRVIELYNDFTKNGTEMTDKVYKYIGQVIGSTAPKVKKIISEYEFNKI